MSIEDVIQSIRTVVAERDAIGMDRWREGHTRYGVIDPIIRALGWNTADPKECHPDLWLTGWQHPDHNTL